MSKLVSIKRIMAGVKENYGLKKFKNEAERLCYEELTSQGWFVTKKGWPDFICYKGENIALVEVKADQTHRLKKAQFRLLSALARYGIKCFVWRPDVGVMPIPAPHREQD